MCAPAIPLALTLASTAIGGISAWQSANHAAQVANRNAQQALILAADAKARGEQKADAERRKTGFKIGQIGVGLAGRGIDTGSGMALDMIGDTALIGELDTQIIRQNADREAQGREFEAEQFKSEAKAAKRAGMFKVAEVVLGGASDFVTKSGKSYPNFFS